MQYRVAPLFCRPWTLNGISPRLMESHYEHNYGDTVARLNAITNELAALDPASTAPDVISRLKRDELAASIRPCCTSFTSQASAAMAERPRMRWPVR